MEHNAYISYLFPIPFGHFMHSKYLKFEVKSDSYFSIFSNTSNPLDISFKQRFNDNPGQFLTTFI